jgi:NitT/TauT family transport system substrate-binding protein
MKLKISKHTGFLYLFALAIFLGACTGQSSKGLDETTEIKIAVLPILDTLPMYVAEENGYFAKHNLEVEFVPAGSAPKRDELINSGQVDGMINEVVSTIFYNREETRVQIVRYARVATSDSAIFRILSSGQSGISDVSELKGVEIGVSKGTVIEYLTDRLLQAEGFSPDEIQVVAVPDIGQRMTLLGSGELDAAMLPDPLASLVMQQGAELVLEDSLHPEFSHSVYSFRKEFIDENDEVIDKFLAAIEEAVLSINADPEIYSDLLVERKLVPAPLVGKFSVPKFTTAGVPTQEQWDDVISWIIDKGIDVGSAKYNTSVSNKFLPR